MFCTIAGHSAGHYLTPLGKIMPESLDVLIINKSGLVGTESTELSFLKSSMLQFLTPYLVFSELGWP